MDPAGPKLQDNPLNEFRQHGQRLVNMPLSLDTQRNRTTFDNNVLRSTAAVTGTSSSTSCNRSSGYHRQAYRGIDGMQGGSTLDTIRNEGYIAPTISWRYLQIFADIVAYMNAAKVSLARGDFLAATTARC